MNIELQNFFARDTHTHIQTVKLYARAIYMLWKHFEGYIPICSLQTSVVDTTKEDVYVYPVYLRTYDEVLNGFKNRRGRSSIQFTSRNEFNMNQLVCERFILV